MPTLVSKTLTNADITGSNNFLSVITTTNALQNTGATSTALTTSFVATPTSFAGAGETLTAIGLEVGAVGVLTGVTITIRLRNVTDGVNTDYTYDATLLTTGGRGWNFFSLGAGQVLTASKSWQIQISANTASRINLLRSATVGDWNRIFVTNTNATFATGDTLYLGGRLLTTGSITPTSMVVNASMSLVSLIINNGASLSWTSNSLTMTLSGSLFVFPGSSFTIGTSLSPVAGKIEFVNASFGLNAFSVFGPCTFNIYGSDVSSNYVINLASTASSGQPNAVLVSAPDWVNGQEVAYTSSSAVNGSEVETVSSVSGNTVTNASPFGSSHPVQTVGTRSPVQDVAKACLMNRGFVVCNTTGSTGSWFGSIYGAVVCNWDNVYFKDQGANVAAVGLVPSKNGWIVDITSGGSFIVDNCSFYPSSQSSTSGISCENSVTRLGTDYTITNCLFVSRSTAFPAAILRKGAIGANTTISGCIAMCTAATTNGYAIITRNDNSANINISNCFSYGFPALLNRNDNAVNGIGTITVDNCFSIGAGFYLSSLAYSSSAFILGNTTISNCIAINNLVSTAFAAISFVGITTTNHTISSCNFIGFNRYFYTASSVAGGTTFDNCIFEDDSRTSQYSIFVGIGGRPNAAFKNCYFYTNEDGAFLSVNWSNLPLYSGGSFYFKDCSFNDNNQGLNFVEPIQYFAGFFATLENCELRVVGNNNITINRTYVKMGFATVSTDTFSGSGKSIALRPYANEATYPFRYQFLLPTPATNFTVNFKTKSYGLDGTVVAYIQNAFGVVTQSTLTVSSGWDSQSINVTAPATYTEVFNLTIELTGTSGYIVIDDITVGNADGIITSNGTSTFLANTSTASETSHTFC